MSFDELSRENGTGETLQEKAVLFPNSSGILDIQ